MSLPNVFRELLRIPARVGFPGTLVRLGDAAGRLLYLELQTGPMVQVAALELEDVRALHAAVGEWIRDREDAPLYTSSDGRRWQSADAEVVPLVAGRIGATLRDAAATVQFCTVPDGVQAADQDR